MERVVTDLGPHNGQAMGLNVFIVLTKLGIGSLVFAVAMIVGPRAALVMFGARRSGSSSRPSI